MARFLPPLTEQRRGNPYHRSGKWLMSKGYTAFALKRKEYALPESDHIDKILLDQTFPSPFAYLNLPPEPETYIHPLRTKYRKASSNVIDNTAAFVLS